MPRTPCQKDEVDALGMLATALLQLIEGGMVFDTNASRPSLAQTEEWIEAAAAAAARAGELIDGGRSVPPPLHLDVAIARARVSTLQSEVDDASLIAQHCLDLLDLVIPPRAGPGPGPGLREERALFRGAVIRLFEEDQAALLRALDSSSTFLISQQLVGEKDEPIEAAPLLRAVDWLAAHPPAGASTQALANREVRLHSFRAEIAQQNGKLEEALDHLRYGQEILDASGADVPPAWYLRRGKIEWAAGNQEAAIQVLDDELTRAEASDDPAFTTLALGSLAILCSYLRMVGRSGDAEIRARRGLALAATLPEPLASHARLHSLWPLAEALTSRRDLAGASEVILEAVELAERVSLPGTEALPSFQVQRLAAGLCQHDPALAARLRESLRARLPSPGSAATRLVELGTWTDELACSLALDDAAAAERAAAEATDVLLRCRPGEEREQAAGGLAWAAAALPSAEAWSRTANAIETVLARPRGADPARQQEHEWTVVALEAGYLRFGFAASTLEVRLRHRARLEQALAGLRVAPQDARTQGTLQVGNYVLLAYLSEENSPAAWEALHEMLAVQDVALERTLKGALADGPSLRAWLQENSAFPEMGAFFLFSDVEAAATDLRAVVDVLVRRRSLVTAQLSAVQRARRRTGGDVGARLEVIEQKRAALASVQLAVLTDPSSARGAGGEHLERLRRELRTLEQEAGAVLYHDDLLAIGASDVRGALEPGDLLVDFVLYPDYAKDRRPTLAAVAFTSDLIRLVPVGPAAPVETLVRELRACLRRGEACSLSEARRMGRTAWDLLLAPVITEIDPNHDTSRLFVTGDGVLHLTPWPALVDEAGQFLVERFEVAALDAPRHIVDRVAEGEPGSSLVLGAPAFGQGRQGLRFEKLPGTATELVSVTDALERVGSHGVQSFDGEAATETRIKDAASPYILHLATHAFFLRDDAEAAAAPLDKDGRRMLEPTRPLPSAADDSALSALGTTEGDATVDPLLRAGIALAGAGRAQLPGETDDGILTAAEIAFDVDLSGTELVVLSACETGVGDTPTWGGVAGLREGLRVAGARQLVLSLWPVADEATATLMGSFYGNLGDAADACGALRSAQLAQLAAGGSGAHPGHWASFITIGACRPMEP